MVKTMLLPMIKKYYKLLLSIMIVSALGCTIMTGLSSSHKSLEKTLYDYVKDYNYPSGVITTEVTPRSIINKVSKEIEIVPRLSLDTILIHDKKYLSSKIITYGKKDFYKFYVWESIEDEGLYLDYNFAKENNISPGDKLKVKVDKEYKEFLVSKIVSTPETLSITSSNQFSGFNSDFGYVYVEDAIIKKELKKEHEKQKVEVEEKEKDLEEKKDEAEKEYDAAKEELNNYEYLLNVESNKLDLLKQKIEEANLYLEELENEKISLQSRREELITQEEKLREAKDALKEINEKKEELNDAKEQLEELQSLMDFLSKLPPDIEIEKIVREVTILNNLTNLLEEYDIPMDLEGNIWQVANRIETRINQITEDYEYMNSDATRAYISSLTGREETEEYEKLFNTVRRYYPFLRESNLPQGIETAINRIERLNDIITSSDIISTVREIGSLEEENFKALIDGVIENKDTLMNYETTSAITNDYNFMISNDESNKIFYNVFNFGFRKIAQAYPKHVKMN